jgi:hypothetical protein
VRFGSGSFKHGFIFGGRGAAWRIGLFRGGLNFFAHARLTGQVGVETHGFCGPAKPGAFAPLGAAKALAEKKREEGKWEMPTNAYECLRLPLLREVLHEQKAPRLAFGIVLCLL